MRVAEIERGRKRESKLVEINRLALGPGGSGYQPPLDEAPESAGTGPVTCLYKWPGLPTEFTPNAFAPPSP